MLQFKGWPLPVENKPFWLMILLLFIAYEAKAEFRDKVVVVESYHSGYPWVQAYRKGLESVLLETHEIRYFEMDTKRIPPQEFEQRAIQAWDYLQVEKPTHIVLADDNAVRLLGAKLHQRKIPFTYLGVNSNPRAFGIPASKKIAGVLERLIIRRSIFTINKVYPIQKVLVLFDNGFTSQAIFESTFEGKNEHNISDIFITVKNVRTFSEWKRTILNAKQQGYQAIFLGLYQSLRNENGDALPEEKASEWLSSNSPIPPFALWDYAVGKNKTIGGLVISGFQHGVDAANVLLEMHHDKRTHGLPETGYGTSLIFSKSQLEKWEISIEPNAFKEIQYIE